MLSELIKDEVKDMLTIIKRNFIFYFFICWFGYVFFAKYKLNTSLNTLKEILVLNMDEIERIENKLLNCYDEENDPRSQV